LKIRISPQKGKKISYKLFFIKKKKIPSAGGGQISIIVPRHLGRCFSFSMAFVFAGVFALEVAFFVIFLVFGFGGVFPVQL